MSLKLTLGFAAVALCLSACETSSQYTSGADYLARYPDQTLLPASSSTTSAGSNIDASIR